MSGTARFTEAVWCHPAKIQLYTDASAKHGSSAFPKKISSVAARRTKLDSSSTNNTNLPGAASLERFFHQKTDPFALFTPVVQAWATHNSTSHVQEVMRRMNAVAANSNFAFPIKHIAGLNNSIADALTVSAPALQKVGAACNPAADAFPNVFSEFILAFHSTPTDHSSSAELLLNSRIASSTSRTYANVLRKFYLFCNFSQGVFLPASPQLGIELLANSFDNGLSYATAKVYRAAISDKHHSFDLPSPTSAALVLQDRDDGRL